MMTENPSGSLQFHIATSGYGITMDYLATRVAMSEKFFVWPRENPFPEIKSNSRDWLTSYADPKAAAEVALANGTTQHRLNILRIELTEVAVSKLRRAGVLLGRDNDVRWSVRKPDLMRLPEDEVRFTVLSGDGRPAIPLDQIVLPPEAREFLKAERLDCVQSLLAALLSEETRYASSLQAMGVPTDGDLIPRLRGQEIAAARSEIVEGLTAAL
jgi:hypothetical protein